MNIVVLTPINPIPPIGGWALAIYQDLLGLAELGHRLHLFGVTQEASPAKASAPFECPARYVVRRKQARWLRVLQNVTEPYPFIVSHLVVNELVDMVSEHIAKHPTDLILAEDVVMSPVAYRVRERTGKPVYLRLHNVAAQILDRFGAEQPNPIVRCVARWQGRKTVSFERSAIESADGVSAVSDSDDRALVELLPGLKRSRDIIGFGANLDELPCQVTGRDPRVIMHLGSLMQYTKLEGMEWFCREVLPVVHKRHADVVLELAGNMPPDAFRDVPGVRRLGVVDDPLPSLHRGQVFIAPQFVGSGMRLKLLNAMATGNAVVCTRVACEGIPIEDGRHALVRDDAPGFAEAVLRLLDDPPYAQMLGTHARALVEQHFDYRAIAAKLSECMARCV